MSVIDVRQTRARQSGTRGALATLLAVILAFTLLPPTVASAQDTAPQAAAADYLVGIYDSGDVSGSPGGLADLIFALAGADQAPDTVAAARADLEALAADYLAGGGDNPGQLGKALLAIRVAGGEGAELEAALREELENGDNPGQFGSAGAFLQALAVMSLTTTDDGVPPSSIDWLASRQCPNGGFEFGPDVCTTDGGGEVDTTTLVIQALDGGNSAAVDGAVEWLLGRQADDGSFAFATGSDGNANSTGLAGQALRSVGKISAANRAADFVETLQIPEGNPNAGAIQFQDGIEGSLFLATTQGLLSLGAPAFPSITAGQDQFDPRGTACDGSEGVTVIVDLTLFDEGVLTGCAPGDPGSGLEALRTADFEVETETDPSFGEFVCAIEGLPELACDQPFEGNFWAYFQGAQDGSWAAYQVGAADSDPEPGDIEGWRYGDGAAPSEPATQPPVDTPTDTSTDTSTETVRRLSGTDRITTAIAISQDRFPDGSAGAVALARADIFADALPGTPLATDIGGPLLINPSDTLDQRVIDEIARTLPDGGRIVILGGTAAISDDVVDALTDLGYDVVRAGGADRIETAIEVARAIGDPGQLLITTGYNFPDALSAGAAAAATQDGAVLLTGDGTPHPAVDSYLAERAGATVYAVGGPAAQAYPDVTAVVGATREATAVAVAETFFDIPNTVGIARREDFADALAGGYHIATLGGPLLISPGDVLSAEVVEYLCRTDSVEDAVVYGGEVAIGQAVIDGLVSTLDGSACS